MKKCFIILVLIIVSFSARAQKWAVSTNALDYVNFLTLNIEGSVAVHRNFTLDVGAKFNPWVFGNHSVAELQKYNKQRMYYAGARWYPWFVYDGWHVDAMIGWKEYSSAGALKQTAEEGDAFGGGFGGGYTLLIHKNINLEFGAMFWAGRKTYNVFACPYCGKLLESGSKWFIMPTNITIGVSWVFGNNKYKEQSQRAERGR